MAEHLESTLKKYPHDEEEIKYEKEIVDAIKKLPIEQRFQAIALNNYILMRKQLDVEVENQIQDIVRKYNKVQAPLMDNVNQIIAGDRAPTEQELEDAKAHLTAEELTQIGGSLNSEAIPEYWSKVLTSCLKLKPEIHEADLPVIKHITKIEHFPEDEGEHFSFKFHFSQNEFFSNDVLTVRFVMLDENEVERIEGTEINWKEGKDITKKTITKKQKNKKTGKTRTINKTVDAESFFNFFKSVDGAEGGDDEEEEDEEGGQEQRIAISQEIALTLQDEIVSYHLEYYLGLRTGEEDLEDELGGIDEEDEEDEDDEEEGGHGHKHTKNCSHKHKPAPKGGAGAGAGGDKQECKQQ